MEALGIRVDLLELIYGMRNQDRYPPGLLKRLFTQFSHIHENSDQERFTFYVTIWFYTAYRIFGNSDTRGNSDTPHRVM